MSKVQQHDPDQGACSCSGHFDSFASALCSSEMHNTSAKCCAHAQLQFCPIDNWHLARRSNRSMQNVWSMCRVMQRLPVVLEASITRGEGLTCMVSSMRLVSRLPGMKPAPMPWILWGPGAPPLMTGDSVGSTATICTAEHPETRECDLSTSKSAD